MRDAIQETFDVPCIEGGGVGGKKQYSEEQQKLERESFEFLQKEAEKFGAVVEKKMNPHDFGMYPSFELFVYDIPHDVDDCSDCEKGNPCKEYDKDPDNEKYNALWDNINGLHDRYYKRFEKYL